MVDTQQELFEHELRDIYDAEHKLVRALGSMAKKVSDDGLSKGFADHRKATQNHVKRLEQVFRVLDRKPRREPCKGINGLIGEFNSFAKEEDPSDEVLNAFAVGAALKVEQYEIVAYQSLLRLAGALGLSEALDPLAQNLAEEQRTATELEGRADQLSGPVTVSGSKQVDPIAISNADREEIVLPEASTAVAGSEMPPR